jgi:hypothetical protein
MKPIFTLTVVLVLFTICSFGQKKEIMRNNLHSNNGVKTRADRHFSHGMNHQKPGDRQNDFFTAKSKTRHLSGLKSAEAVKQRLDSLVGFYGSVPGYKVYFTYDSKGNNTQELEYEWDSNTNTWFVYKYEYTYDASGNITQEAGYDWDSNTIAWIASYKADYSYDANGNMTQEREFTWDSNSNAWVGADKGNKSFTYDANGNITQETNYDWDINTKDWVAGDRNKYEHTYYSNGSIAQELEYYWNSNTNDWYAAATRKTDYSYDSKGNNTQKVAYSWDSWVTNSWVGYYKNEYTYDANGHMTQRRDYNWDSNTNAWVYRDNESTSNYTYDANGNQTSEIRTRFDPVTSQLIHDNKFELSYDLSYFLSDLIFPWDWLWNDEIMNMPLEESYYDWDKASNSWVEDEKYVYYYSQINFTSVPKTVAVGIDIYPNPVSDYIKVSGVSGDATFNLYNLQGKLILSKTLTANEPVNISGLSKGAYTYNLIEDRKQQAGKLIKK